jgi:hypothetical protein
MHMQTCVHPHTYQSLFIMKRPSKSIFFLGVSLWCPILFVNLTGHSEPHLNIILERYLWSVPGKISMWIRWPSETEVHPQCGWELSDLLKTWMEQKGSGRETWQFLPGCLSWEPGLLFLWLTFMSSAFQNYTTSFL